MDIFLDDITSLMLLRAVLRDNNGLALKWSDCDHPTAFPIRYPKLHLLGMPELLGYLHIPDEHQLGIVVPSIGNRIRAHDFRCKTRSKLRGLHPFMQLTTTSTSQPSLLLPRETKVNILSPTNIVLDEATELQRQVHCGNLKQTQAFLMLFRLCSELCGTYSHDPFDPQGGRVVYNTKPLLDANTLRDALAAPGRERGLALAREVAQLVYNKSGSPQETFLGPALFFPSKYGGLHLCEFDANTPLNLTPQERASINYRKITPDFTLTQYRTVVEYLGKVHLEGDNPRLDHQRSLDYQTLGYREFDFLFNDVCTRSKFMQSAARIVSAIAAFEGPKAHSHYLRLANDPVFIEKQRALFSVFRPSNQ